MHDFYRLNIEFFEKKTFVIILRFEFSFVCLFWGVFFVCLLLLYLTSEKLCLTKNVKHSV